MATAHPTLTPSQYRRLVEDIPTNRGSYLGMGFNVVSADFDLVTNDRIEVGCFVVVQNYYGQVVLWVSPELRLVEIPTP